MSRMIGGFKFGSDPMSEEEKKNKAEEEKKKTGWFRNFPKTDSAKTRFADDPEVTGGDRKKISTVIDEGITMIVSRITDDNAPEHCHTYRVHETREQFYIEGDMYADEAYWVWRKNNPDMPSLKHRFEKGVCREHYNNLCGTHKVDNHANFVESMQQDRLDTRCYKCNLDVLSSGKARFVNF